MGLSQASRAVAMVPMLKQNGRNADGHSRASGRVHSTAATGTTFLDFSSVTSKVLFSLGWSPAPGWENVHFDPLLCLFSLSEGSIMKFSARAEVG